MGEAIGGVLAPAVGVALSPIPIVAVVLMLSTPKGRVNGPAFGLGWILGLVAVTLVVLFATSGADDPSSSAADGTNTALVVAGVALAVVGLRQWRKRPKAGEEPEMPGWMATIDEFGPGKALGLGVVLSGVNPKNLVLTAAAAASFSTVSADGAEILAGEVVFLLIACSTVVGLVLAHLVLGDKVSARLDSLKTTMANHNAVIMAVICWVLAAKLIGDGTGRLSG
jgi:threonine/homoserine/homoserine lactone efflux protein